MVAGPNGAGKTSLVRKLARDCSVNFYQMLNADDLMRTALETHRLAAPAPIPEDGPAAFAGTTAYLPEVIALFKDGRIRVETDCLVFDRRAVNSYSIALAAAYFREVLFSIGASFSLETVFSHPSKVDALRRAKELGYRTYLYFVATDDPAIHVERVAARAALGGHSVPEGKIRGRYERSLALVRTAFPFLSRAFFFDNAAALRFLGSYEEGRGFSLVTGKPRPAWFSDCVL